MKNEKLRAAAAAILVSALLCFTFAQVARAQDAGPAAASPAAHAAAPTPSPDDGLAFAKAVMDAVQSHQWSGVAALTLIALVWALRKFSGKLAGAASWLSWMSWLRTDRGGAVLVMLTSVVGILSSSLLAGKAYSGSLLLQSVYLGFMAAGGWAWTRKFLGYAEPAPSKS